ncbi:hypothetical protein [Bradyrhizobium sp. STM 3557]|uniref:hypothetical protein n=1 Tax=Bradyrhizobium sp. STM 3557 TaxID=578920 RepID=UPI00388DB018
MIFRIFALTMAIACVVATLLFPSVSANDDGIKDSTGFTRPVWLAIIGLMAMALVQAIIFSFLERMGAHRGFAPGQIQGVFVVMGLLAILPTLLAALLEKSVSPITVGIVDALAQGIIAIIISCSTGVPYAAAVAFPFVMLFTHTFIFGHLAQIEPTGRRDARHDHVGLGHRTAARRRAGVGAGLSGARDNGSGARPRCARLLCRLPQTRPPICANPQVQVAALVLDSQYASGCASGI